MTKTDDFQALGGDNAAGPEHGPSAATSVAAKIGAKNLKIIIITMPFVFLIVVGAIIAVFGKPRSSKADDATVEIAAAAPPAASAAFADIEYSLAGEGGFNLPAGAEIKSMAIDGDRLAIHIDLENGAAIVIYDLQQDAVIKTIPIARAN